MGLLIVGGTIGLVVLLVQRVAPGAGGSAWEMGLGQPEGARIAGIAAAEGGVAVWVTRPDGDRVVVVDAKRGRVVGEIRPGR